MPSKDMQSVRRFNQEFPELASLVAAALIAENRPDLAEQLDIVSICSASYDETVDAGYIYFSDCRSLNVGEMAAIQARFSECVALDMKGVVAVDVDNVGRLMGLELLGYSEIFRQLELTSR